MLIVSLSLVIFLVIGLRPRPDSSPSTAALPTATRQALVAAPTRALSGVRPLPTATVRLMIPTSVPVLPTEIPPTPGIAAPRMFLSANTMRSGSMLANYCGEFGSPVSLRLFDWTTGSTVSLSDESIARVPLSWDASKTIWRGYRSARPFDQPDDAREHWKVNLFLPDGSERWIDILISPTTPDVYYVYSFERTDPFADANGEHYGFHPCRAFSIAAAEVQSYLTTIEQFQDIVRFPALITGDDPRWVRGIAKPMSGAGDLRSIPTTAYNDPIGSIKQEIAVWFARDPEWGAWAQVKLGSVQGWVDSEFVALTPER